MRLLLALVSAFALLPGAASAATFTVNSTSDGTDVTPGNGSCLSPAFTCTLRAATQEANALGGADTIVVPAGTYTLTLTGGGYDPVNAPVSASRDLDLTDDTTVQGAGPESTIIQAGTTAYGGIDRVLEAWGANTEVKVTQLTLRNGLNQPGTREGGGGVNAQGADLTLDHVTVRDSQGCGGGGAALEVGTNASLHITDSTIDHNLSPDSDTYRCDAGGVRLIDFDESSESSSITRSTISDNSAAFDGGVSVGGVPVTIDASTIVGNSSTVSNGGGVVVELTDDPVTITRSTITGNSAFNVGGGLYVNVVPGTPVVRISDSTIADNSAAGYGGIFGSEGSPAVNNTIVADNHSTSDGFGNPNCNDEVHSDGENLESGTDCEFTDPTDIQNGNASLAPLGDNGGPTQTLLPGAASDAIDGGGGCDPFDQRGVPRPLDGSGDGVSVCDVGAVEVETVEGPPGDPTCSDFLDNDQDGLADQQDPACQTPEGPPGDATCGDGIDNDGDGNADSLDSDCQYPPEGPPGDSSCSDGVDNDNDGNTDQADSECQSPEGPPGDPSCSDGIDNDGDGNADIADNECQGSTNEGPPG